MSDPTEYALQRDAAASLFRSVVQQAFKQLVAQGMRESAVLDGLTNTCIEAVGVLQGQEEAARLLAAGSLSFLSCTNSHASVEVAVQALRDLLPELQQRIEADL